MVTERHSVMTMRALSFPLHRQRRFAAAGAPLPLRVRVRFTRGRLDRQIAAGWRGESSEALALRGRQLIHPRCRRRVARDLRGTVKYADRNGSGPVISAVVINRAAVRDGRGAILGLAERLAGPNPVSPRGVVLARTLLSDVFDNPLYDPDCQRTVAEAVWEVADALGPDAPTIRFDLIA
jgi:hypothetical protein